MKHVWELVKAEPELMKYFPDIEDDKLPDRWFMWTILSTLRGDACKKLIETARNARGSDSTDHKDELIEVDPDFLNTLMQTPLMAKCKQFL